MEHKLGFDYLHIISKFFQIDSHGHSQCGRYESSVRQYFKILAFCLYFVKNLAICPCFQTIQVHTPVLVTWLWLLRCF